MTAKGQLTLNLESAVRAAETAAETMTEMAAHLRRQNPKKMTSGEVHKMFHDTAKFLTKLAEVERMSANNYEIMIHSMVE